MENHSTHTQMSYNFDAVPRVSIDGKPHEILALIVCLSGLIVATILVSVIVFMLRKAHRKEWPKTKNSSAKTDVESQSTPELIQPPHSHKSKVKIFTIFGSTKQSFDLSTT